MNILITGGAGFIGKSLSRKLMKAGHKVYVLDVIPSTVAGVKSIVGSITDPTLRHDTFWGNIDVCYHLAAMANVNECREKTDKAFMINLYGTFNIVEACREHEVKMLFASTACVYGNTPQHPSTEDGPTCPADLYGVTKRAGEEFVKTLPKYVILRFGTTVGPEMRHALATWVFLNQAHEGKPFTITGNGSQTRNFIYVEDLTDGCVKALKSNNEIFNLVGEKAWSIYQTAEFAAEVVNGTAKNTSWKYLQAREGDVMKEDISIEKAMRMLGWKPKYTLKQALEKSYKEIYK